MKKILCLMGLMVLTIMSGLPCAAALDDEDWDSWRLYDEDTVKTLGQHGDLIIQEKPSTKEIYLYDTKQDKILFSAHSKEDGEINIHGTMLYTQYNSLFFTEDGRILYSTWKDGITEGIKDIQTFELSPDGTEKTLLTEEYAIEKQDLAGRFICLTAGVSIYGQFMQGMPDPYGMMPVSMDDTLTRKGVLDANFDKILIPFDYTRWETYNNYIICGYPLGYDDEDRQEDPSIRMTEGVLNAVTLDWIVPLTKRSFPMYSEYDTELFMEEFRHGWVFSDHTHLSDAQGTAIEDGSFHEGNIVFDSKNNSYQMLGDHINKNYDLTKWQETSEWAANGIAQAQSLDLLPEQLTILYQYPISRRNFCLLLIQTLEKINPQMVQDAIKSAKNVQFFDVDTTSYEYGIPVCSRRICLATALGIVTGYMDQTFRPETLITRQEAAVMLNRMLKVLEANTPQEKTTDYADVDKISTWALEDVTAVSAAGIMNGVGEKKFDPEGTYTLEQSILTMLRIYNIFQS